ncbi:MAG: hypothetical protein HUJ26_20775 [Planctomycetaceae bacterium]|nr:hypothetical protein [Planctomycetaceae bacterium]
MLRLTIFAVTILASTLTAHAAKVPVEAFPAESTVVIRIADIDKSVGKIKDLVAAVDPAQAEVAGASLGGFSGVLIDNPARLGVKAGTDWWFAAIVEKGAPEPALVIAVESEDVAAVKDAVGEGYNYVEYENWLLYSKDADAMKKVEQCVSGSEANISKAIDEKAQKMGMEADLGVFLNIKQLVTDYKPELEAAEANLDIILDAAAAEAQGAAAAAPGVDLEAIMDVYGDLGRAVLKSLNDLDSCLFAMSVSEAGIHCEEYLAVTPGTPTAQYLAGSQTGAMKAFAQLPPNELMYAGVNLDMSAMVKWSSEFMSAILGDEAEEKVDIDALVKDMKALEMGGYVSSFRLGSLQNGLFQVAAVYEVNDGAAAKEVYKNMLQAFSAIDTPFLKQTMTYEDEVETIDGKPVDKVTLKQEFKAPMEEEGELNPQQAQAKAMQQMAMQMMYGPEGAVSRIVYLKDRVLATTGGGSDALAALMKSASSPQANPAFSATRSKLDEQANLIVLFDLPSLIVKGVEIASATGLIPPGALALDGIEPSYLGYSLSASEAGLDAKAHIPTEQIRGIYQIAMQGFMMFQQLNGQ